MGLNDIEKRTAKFVLDEKDIPPYALSDFEKDPNTSYPEEGTGDLEGKYVYEATEKFAAHMVLHGGKVTFDKDNNPTFTPKRYYLIGEKTLDAEYRSPRGAIIWLRLEPWRYVMRNKQVIEDSLPKMEGGKPVYEKFGVWEKVPKKAK
jgi:hypothetical protein